MRTTVDGKAMYEGRTLADWVPTIVQDIVAGFDPLQIVLFGSVRGDDGPDSDIDLLVVLPHVEPKSRHELMSAMSLAISVRWPSTFSRPTHGSSPAGATSSARSTTGRREKGRTVYERPS